MISSPAMRERSASEHKPGEGVGTGLVVDLIPNHAA